MNVQEQKPIAAPQEQRSDMPAYQTPAYQTLDAWRGVASLWVVMYHLSLVMLVNFPQLATLPLYRVGMLGGLGVQMFFVISGYCIANAACKSLARGQGFVPFMQARCRRIYPPCWFALALSVGLSLIAAFLVSSDVLTSSNMAGENVLGQSATYYFANLTLTQGIFHQQFLLAQCWTLAYEMAFYLIIGIVLVPALMLPKRLPLLPVMHLFTCVILLGLILAPQWVSYPLDLWPQFALGILAFDVLSHPHARQPKAWLLGISLLCLAFALTHSYGIGMMGEQSRPSFLFCLLFTGTLIVLYRFEMQLSRLRPIKFLSWVGLFSYSLYLTHFFSIGVVNQALKLVHLQAGYHYLAFALTLIISVGFARFFFQFCERPFIRNAKKPASDLVSPAVAFIAES